MWESDNAIFNVNGIGKDKLTDTLRLAIGDNKISAWSFNKDKGLILYCYTDDKRVNKFPTPLNYKSLSNMVYEWLFSEDAKTVLNEGWDANADHDGSNELGWRVYTEAWGQVNGGDLAIKPSYLWYGK